MMRIYQSTIFGKKVKKLNQKQKQILDNEIKLIAQNPTIGSEKKGDLRGVFVHIFKVDDVQYLLSYCVMGEYLELIMIGPHENYYRDLKSYLKKR
jgi:mRNA-degrading endonuclease RelE of RelBE toxin-antitoxin system